MRVLLVGPSAARARSRAALDGSMQVVGEFPTLDAAEAAHIEADGILLTSHTDGEREDPEGQDEPLTPREIEVLELLAEGLPNKAIATRLGISDQTVKFHVASIAGKLGATNRTDAVRRAVRRGLVTL
jgi:DNA-binding NarL/FixJ family response regulator